VAEDMLSWFQDWYVARCDGDWEHTWGIEIRTIDNPGWTVEIDLAETTQAAVVLARVKVERSTHDWLFYEVVDNKFKAACGPRNLAETLERFRAWSSAQMPHR
jgi:Immunity protein 53